MSLFSILANQSNNVFLLLRTSLFLNKKQRKYSPTLHLYSPHSITHTFSFSMNLLNCLKHPTPPLPISGVCSLHIGHKLLSRHQTVVMLTNWDPALPVHPVDHWWPFSGNLLIAHNCSFRVTVTLLCVIVTVLWSNSSVFSWLFINLKAKILLSEQKYLQQMFCFC